MFYSNAHSRRQKRARTHGYSHTVSNATSGSVPVMKNLEENTGMSKVTRKPQMTFAVVGSTSSKGLNIIGTHEFDHNYPTNPDEKNMPIGSGEQGDDGDPKNQLVEKDFPVTYSGRGNLLFDTPVKIPHIIGPVDIFGDVRIIGDVTGSTLSTGFDLGTETVKLYSGMTELNVTASAFRWQRNGTRVSFSLKVDFSDTITDDAITLEVQDLPFNMDISPSYTYTVYGTGLVTSTTHSIIIAQLTALNKFSILSQDYNTATIDAMDNTLHKTSGEIFFNGEAFATI